MLKRLINRVLLVFLVVISGIARADGISTVGAVGNIDSSLPVYDANAQKNMRASNQLGTSEANARNLNNCGTAFDNAIQKAAQNVATAAAPGDPVTKFHDSINDCLNNIQLISAAFNLPTSLSLTAAFEAILNQLIDKLINDIIMKICTAATGAWNSAVNNAVNTVNTGINQSGVNTFGNFASVSTTSGNTTPAPPMAPAPAAPVPVKSQSSIPGL